MIKKPSLTSKPRIRERVPACLDGLRARMQDAAQTVRAVFERRIGSLRAAEEEGGR